jgi:Protein of unknown function (DUF3489)
MFGSLVRRKPTNILKPVGVSIPANPFDPETLSDRQLVLLSRAAQDANGQISAGDHDAETADVLTKLEQLRLLERVAPGSGDDGFFGANVRPHWYRITPSGLRAIGLGEVPIHDAPIDAMDLSIVPENGEDAGVAGPAEVSDDTAELPSATPVLAKFPPDATASSQEPALVPDMPPQASESDMAPKAGGGASGWPRSRPSLNQNKPTGPSIEHRVLALLSRAGGVSMTELNAETGWQAHSLRAVLSRLRGKGHAIERLPAQVEGKGIYRLVEPEPAATSETASVLPEA